MLVDYSSWREFMVCPASWFEKYIHRRVLRWPRAQRNDNLCLGSLVHEGLQVWQESHQVMIPQRALDANTPDLETYQLALELVHGYSQSYPEERWPLILCEEPLRFPLEEKVDYGRPPYTTGLAKLDAYFYVPEPYTIESGQPGLQFTLSPGWWIHEYKTKAPNIPLGLFMQKWSLNMQASFQMLALQARINTSRIVDPKEIPGLVMSHHVEGVLVNVLEKPHRHVPQRKCKSCQEQYEYATWIPTGDGKYSCPVCGNRQELQPLKENPKVTNPAYYRIMVQRTKEQLDKARQDIIQVGERMEAMRAGGLYSEVWNTESCTQYSRPCQYFTNHTCNSSTLEDTRMMTAPEYRGIQEEI